MPRLCTSHASTLLAAATLFGAVAAPLLAQNRPATTQVPKGRVVWSDEGPTTWAPRPTAPEITANDLRTRLYGFADDSMMGRRIGEPGNYKGTEYIAREFRRLGLKPAGDSGTFFQTLPYGSARFDIAASALSSGGRTFAPRSEWIPVVPNAANGYGGAANLDGVPAVFAGRLGDTSVVLDPAVFRGKVAVFLAAPSTAVAAGGGRAPASFVTCDAVPNKFGAAAAATVEAAARANPATPAARPAAAARDTRAARAGAVAVLIVGLDGASPTTVNAAFAPANGMQPSMAAATAPAAATISSSTASAIFGRSIDGLAVGTAGAPVTARWSYEWRLSASPARNVVAILPGADPARAGEYVLVGAHNDHVGTSPNAVDHDSLRAVNTVTRRQGANDPACIPTAEQQKRIDSLIAAARKVRPPRRDSIFNGADDDGSGSMVLLEIAERFATEKPARSIIFVSHQGEEAGLLGSRWFVDHPSVPLESIVAAHNMDMLGKGRVDQVKFGGPTSVQTLGARRLSREFGDIIDSVNAVRAETMAIDKTWDVFENPMNRFCRSDQVNYVNKSIPVTYFSTGYAQDYHQLTDEPQYIDYEHSARVGRFVHDIMLAIADRRDRPAIAGPDARYPSCGR